MNGREADGREADGREAGRHSPLGCDDLDNGHDCGHETRSSLIRGGQVVRILHSD